MWVGQTVTVKQCSDLKTSDPRSLNYQSHDNCDEGTGILGNVSPTVGAYCQKMKARSQN